MRFVIAGVVVMACAGQVSSQATAPAATFIPAATVTAAFDKGRPLIETGGYKVHASRREAPGMAEVHARDTDVIYVLEGSATVVTGGRVVGGTTTGPDEVRGSSIEGGTEQQLTGGDLFIVPNGVPHQFTAVRAPFLYYVVKPTESTGEGR